MLYLLPDKKMLNIGAGIEPSEIPLETARLPHDSYLQRSDLKPLHMCFIVVIQSSVFNQDAMPQ